MNITTAVEISDNDNAFFVMIIIKQPPVKGVSWQQQTSKFNIRAYLGDSTMIKLPNPRRPPITHCMKSGMRQDMLLWMNPQK